MRPCVIANPVARGMRRVGGEGLRTLCGPDTAIRWTSAAGEARALAAAAVREGFDLLVAAGGDGTVNEVLNGIGDVPGGFERVRLGVLPLGTANVWARERGLDLDLARAWERLREGRERRVDLPWAEWQEGGAAGRRFFVQLAGAGWDALAIERVRAGWKRWLGPWAYVWAGWEALQAGCPPVTARLAEVCMSGPWVLVGNGRFYGGPFELFPGASAEDGWLDVCVVPRLTLGIAVCGGLSVLLRRRLPGRWVRRGRTQRLELSSESPVPFEVDGERAGRTPVTFGLTPGALRVAV